MNAKHPTGLDLNAPLLSTRRPSTTTNTITNIGSYSLGESCNNRVPFSWEQSPGQPKDTVKRDEFEDHTLPLPKPPPIRWQEESYLVYFDIDFENAMDNNEDEYEDEDGDDDDSFSDAIDLFSLAESLNLSSDNPKMRNTQENNEDFAGANESASPNFMIQKFLPAANALAASSLSNLATHQELSTSSAKKRHIISLYPRRKTHCKENKACVPKRAQQIYPSFKGCGLEMFFLWPLRAKHKLCGVKSPVKNTHSSLKPQLSPRLQGNS